MTLQAIDKILDAYRFMSSGNIANNNWNCLNPYLYLGKPDRES